MTTEPSWAPETCTLPTVERPLRALEFEELFATALHGVSRPRPTQLRLSVDPAAEHLTRDLLARESECCSFFTFEFESVDDDLVMHIGVSPTQIDVLDALEARIAAT